MKRLIDADALYEQIAKKEKLAQQRVLDTPSMMPNGNLNPSAIRYTAQLDERTQMKYMIADAPIVDAIPISFIEEQAKLCNEVGFRRGEECYMALIEKWRKKNGTEID
jgi:hypothetical protein